VLKGKGVPLLMIVKNLPY